MASNRTDDVIASPPSAERHIFVSFSRADWSHVQSLTAALKAANIRYWIDFESLVPGQPWRDAIHEALAGSHALLFCLSPLSLESVWAGREVKAARERALQLIPVMVDYVPASQLPTELRDLHIIDMTRLPASGAARTVASRISGMMGKASEWYAPPDGTLDGVILDLSTANSTTPPDVSHLVPASHMAVERVSIAMIDAGVLARVVELVDRAGWVIIAMGDATDSNAMLAGIIGSRLPPGRLTIAQSASAGRSLKDVANVLRAKYLAL